MINLVLRSYFFLSLLLSFSVFAQYENRALFIDGYKDARQVRYDSFRSEKKAVTGVIFIVREDSGGLAMLSELRDAARRGVKVRVIFDDYGATGASSSRKLSEAMVQHLMDEGVEIKIFHQIDSRKYLSPNRLLKRNHQKLWVFEDSNSFILGDRNGSGKYLGFNNPNKPGDWKFLSRDIYVHGPETTKVKKHIDELWDHPSSEPLRPSKPITKEELAAAKAKLDAAHEKIKTTKLVKRDGSADDWKARTKPVKKLTFIGDKPVTGEGVSHKKLLTMLAESKKSAVLETPYFILNSQNEAAIEAAKKAHGKIEILTNGPDLTDEVWVPPVADSDLRKMSKNGIPVYEFAENRITHTKSYIFDEEKIYFGSNNFDNRSQNWDLEAGVVIEDKEMAKDLKVMVDRDRASSKLMDHNRPSVRSKNCIRWGLAQLIRGIL